MLLKNNKKINKLKDKIKLFIISLSIMLGFLLIMYIQMKTKEDYFLDIIFVILGSVLLSYYSYLSVSTFMEKYKKVITIGVFINTLIISFYFVILFLFRTTFHLGLFFHGLLLIAELFIFRLAITEIIKRINKKNLYL